MSTDAHEETDATSRRVAHDLLQSIVIIQSLTGAERATAAPGSPLDERLVLIQKEAQTMAQLCERQLGRHPQIGWLDLAEVAARTVERARCTYRGRVDLEATPAPIEGDALEWERCLFNLAANACQAAGEEGQVEVQVWSTADDHRVRVGDSGPGFGRTVTGRASLGMVTVSHVVDRHGGHLEVGQSPLGGAELTVVIPVVG